LKKTDNHGLFNCVIINSVSPRLFDFQLKPKAKHMLDFNMSIDL